MTKPCSTMISRTVKTRLAAFLIAAAVVVFPSCVVNNDGNGNGDEPESAYGWSWESGSKTAAQVGAYGTKGTASASNVPGAREFALAWGDSAGNAWIFGGFGYATTQSSGYLNDLWKYSPTRSEWTWVSGGSAINQWGIYGTRGVAAASNVPGSRSGALTWLDADGTVWIFGGRGFDADGSVGYLNDLWKYDSASGHWTWIAGSNSDDQGGDYGTKGVSSPTNLPGGRYGAVSWLDGNGRLWLFGGYGLDGAGSAGDLNDLWRFDPATIEWTWVSGDEVKNLPGVYGNLGTPAPSNCPGARDTSVGWRDAAGNFWLFGGGGYASTVSLGQLNDLWRFDPATLQWTWIAGFSSVNQSGVYGIKGTASTSNIPGGDCGANAWVDPNGLFWFFGGQGYDATGTLGALQDLWKLDPATLAWAWISGSKTADQAGEVAAISKRYLTNLPGGRKYAASFRDSGGNLWVFGGTGYDDGGVHNYLNDLWKYTR